MIIAIDLDSTLNNLCAAWLDRYNQDSGERVRPDDIKCWDTHKYVKCGKQIYNYLTPDLFASLVPVPYAVGVTRGFVAAGDELVIVSAMAPSTFDVKRDWCTQYFPHIPHFIGTHSKQFIRADILIDDGPHNLEAWRGHAIAFDQPWNQTWGGQRAYSWLEMGVLVNQYAEEVMFKGLGGTQHGR